mmetsp:Transcript_12936/g.29196  ORF Transcript_12936/g.29196 Transcript_12936/m.29196 type:complete len:282 (-) Transcript_12936:13-858(-)
MCLYRLKWETFVSTTNTSLASSCTSIFIARFSRSDTQFREYPNACLPTTTSSRSSSRVPARSRARRWTNIIPRPYPLDSFGNKEFSVKYSPLSFQVLAKPKMVPGYTRPATGRKSAPVVGSYDMKYTYSATALDQSSLCPCTTSPSGVMAMKSEQCPTRVRGSRIRFSSSERNTSDQIVRSDRPDPAAMPLISATYSGNSLVLSAISWSSALAPAVLLTPNPTRARISSVSAYPRILSFATLPCCSPASYKLVAWIRKSGWGPSAAAVHAHNDQRIALLQP